MFDYRRTHHCGALNKKNIGDKVSLSGWVHKRRDLGGLIFIDLRDRFGLTQLIFDPKVNPPLHQAASQLRQEWVVNVKGVVIARSSGMANLQMATGEIEIKVEELQVLSMAKTPPLSVSDDFIEVNEELRLQYRYLDMRRGDILKKLVMRHESMLATRNYLSSQGFCEVTTPVLAKSTPEGARDYLVPSRIYPGHFFALPQSPQIFKQLLMVAGLDRYFQIATCFRDEDLRADRQPEFSQIDMEMSFGFVDDLFTIVEGLVSAIFKQCLNITIETPFIRVPYSECIEKYGSDKPDLRFGMPLCRVDKSAEQSSCPFFHQALKEGGCIKTLCIEQGASLSRKELEEYALFAKQMSNLDLYWLKYQEGILSTGIAKFFSGELQSALIAETGAKDGDLILFCSGPEAKVNQTLDHLRRKIARQKGLIDPNKYAFLWVVDFPLFKKDPETGQVESEHHPFTSPHLEDLHLLESDPLKVRSSSYDLVLNGYEMASGSQRIHDSQLQALIFKILKLSQEELVNRFGFFIEALSYGTPPHLGIALGFDRLNMILSQTENIRDVIAFPKNQKAKDLMMNAPSDVLALQLKELKLLLEK